MRSRGLGTFAGLVLAACLAQAAPPEAPTKVETAPGDLVQFQVKIEKGKKLGWESGFDQLTDCEVYRLHSDDPDTYSFLLRPKRTGSFYFVCWTVGDEDAKGARTLISVREGGGGGGTDDPLITKIRTAYGMEKDANRADQMRALARVYDAGAIAADDNTIKTYGDLFAVMTTAATENGVTGKLSSVQAVISAELKLMLPVRSQDALDFSGRIKAKAAFVRISKAITEGAK